MRHNFLVLGVLLIVTPFMRAQTRGEVRRLNPATLHQPRGYTHVVVVRGGETVYVAGQVPLDKDGKLVGANDPAAQIRQVFENLKRALQSANVDFRDIVSLNIYLTDIRQIDTFRKVRDEYMKGDELPASTLVEVKSLFRPDVMIEVSAVAVRR